MGFGALQADGSPGERRLQAAQTGYRRLGIARQAELVRLVLSVWELPRPKA